jgi:hypothetical protein
VSTRSFGEGSAGCERAGAAGAWAEWLGAFGAVGGERTDELVAVVDVDDLAESSMTGTVAPFQRLPTLMDIVWNPISPIVETRRRIEWAG